jgi:hypothetical protein
MDERFIITDQFTDFFLSISNVTSSIIFDF